tara:strand:- start:244 stop:843 length:600 start_codon:yes stop_codon:yes gene_type:complete
MENIKAVVIGDGTVGKTCMLISYTTNTFDQEYIPTVFDTYSTQIMLDNQLLSYQLWDTAGQEDFDRLRCLSYPETDVFLICFSLISPTSLENIFHKWIPELNFHNPNTPFILVGTKQDLLNDPTLQDYLTDHRIRDVDRKKAQDTVNNVPQCKGYFECSALTQKGLRQTFESALLVAAKEKKKKVSYSPSKRARKCKIL